MTNITDFKPKNLLKAEKQLENFIAWAKEALLKAVPGRVYSSINWDQDSWHISGINGAAFTSLGSTRSDRILIQAPFVDVVKALIVHRYVFQRKDAVRGWLDSLRVLEVALIELTGGCNITMVSAAVCDEACKYMKAHYSQDSAYKRSKALERVVVLLHDKNLVAQPFRWGSPLAGVGRGTLDQQRKFREKKLPSKESLEALGEIFQNDLSDPMDIMVTSACGLLLSTPSRIGELADIQKDSVFHKEDANGNTRMFLRWYAEKKKAVLAKPVVTGMEPVIERVMTCLVPITNEAREYAGWLEDHPDEFPDHDGLPAKGPDEPLSYAEVCAALKIPLSPSHSPRSRFKACILKTLCKKKVLKPPAKALLNEIVEGWDTSKGKRICVDGKIQGHEFNDVCAITLRKLNVLMRERYLPGHFPYTTPPQNGKSRIKYRDALFTIRTGALTSDGVNGKKADWGVMNAADSSRMSVQLGGCSKSKKKSIFHRYGYKEVKVNTHAFRHELNTEMHRAGLSQLLIDAFSGRTTMGSVYNHTSVEERTQAVALVHPKTKQSNAAQRLEKIKTRTPLQLSDVTELQEGQHDRVVHQTHLGICTHSFANEPCPKIGACLSCGNLGCVKGDNVKLSNLKEERAYLHKRFEDAKKADVDGLFGAAIWREKVEGDLLKCHLLIQALENPERENGDILWNRDNGWTVTKNAAAMAGLIEVGKLELPEAKNVLPSLGEWSTELGAIEGYKIGSFDGER